MIEPFGILAAIAAAGAIFFAASAIIGALGSSRRQVTARLAGQSGEGSTGAPQNVPASALRREDKLGNRLGDAPVLGSFRSDLQRSGLSWRLADYVGMIVAAAALLGIVAFIVTGSLPLMIAGAAIGGLLPVFFVKRRIGKRASLLNSQVVDMIDLVAASQRAGFGFVQSIELATREQPEPMAAELIRTIREINLGVSTDEALERFAARTGDPDIGLVVTAVLIQRKVGGNLVEVLGNIAHTIRERVRIRGEIRTLTAQARMSSWIIGLLPPALAVVMSFMQPEYMSVMWTEPMGRMLVMLAIFLEMIGFFLLRRIARIDY